MSKWKAFDTVGDKIIKIFNDMAGSSTMLAALFAILVLGFKKNPYHPFVYVTGLAALYLTVVVFRGYQRGLRDILPSTKDISESGFWKLFSFFSAALMSFIPFFLIIALANSFL